MLGKEGGTGQDVERAKGREDAAAAAARCSVNRRQNREAEKKSISRLT